MTRRHREPLWTALALMGCMGTAMAEVVLDGSLGPGGSLLGPDYQIEAGFGQQRGPNLFHSFERFSIANTESATFLGPASIDNVFGRVTGTQSSIINGVLRSSIPGASLYLINPQGVLIGPQAQLDVDGSFHASSADHLSFADGSRFSARAPDASVLSVADPAAFGFLGPEPASVIVDGAQLAVDDGQQLSLVGGNVLVTNGAALAASNGRVRIGAGASGEFAISGSAPANAPSELVGDGQVRIENGSLVNVDAADGSIHLSGNEVGVAGSAVVANAVGDEDAGHVTIQGRERVSVGQGAIVQSAAAGTGDSGRIHVDAPQVAVTDGGELNTTTFGAGEGGEIEIRTGTLELGTGGRIRSDGAQSALGGPGTVSVEASESVRVEDSDGDGRGTFFMASPFGPGSGGRIRIHTPRLELRGGEAGIAAVAWAGGDAGVIELDVGELRVEDGASVDVYSAGSGRGGTLQVHASDAVTLQGGRAGFYGSALGTGEGGTLSLQAPSLALDNAVILFNTFGEGQAGSTTLGVDSLRVERSSRIDAGSQGPGDGGTIDIEADATVTVSGRMEEGAASLIGVYSTDSGSGGRARIVTPQLVLTDDGRVIGQATGTGFGGSIEIETGTLEVTDGGEISSEAFFASPGGGDISVRATDSIRIVGRSEGRDPNPGSDRVSTGIFSFTGDVAIQAPEILIDDSGAISTRTHNDADSGRLSIETERLTLLDGGQINADSFGSSFWTGRAGDIEVKATESVLIAGETGGRSAGIQAGTRSSGDAGRILVRTPMLRIADDGIINTGTGVFGEGSAGDIVIESETVALESGGRVLSSSLGSGDGGSILIQAGQSLSLRGGSISAFGFQDGVPGEVELVAPDMRFEAGLVNTEAAGSKKAGDIRIRAGTLSLADGTEVRSDSSGFGDAGLISIQVDGTFSANASTVSTGADQATGGNIEIRADTVRLKGESPITATVAGGEGDGGNVTIWAAGFGAVENSDITARADQGFGGRITLNADVFLRSDDVDLDASSNVIGNEGVVEVNAPELDLSGSLIALSDNFVDAAGLLKDPCVARSVEGRGSFVVRGRGGVIPSPDTWLGAASAPAIDGALEPLAGADAGAPDRQPTIGAVRARFDCAQISARDAGPNR